MDHLLKIRENFYFIASISGGKDSQAMLAWMSYAEYNLHSIIHCDLGKVEWPESLPHCHKIAKDYFNMPLIILKRKDGLGLLEYWQRRMNLLKGTGKPFWSSSKARYCTSDLKRMPSDTYFRTLPTDKIIVSCEGIRGDESPARAKKESLSIRKGITSTYYNDMTVEQAIANFKPGKRLALSWYPIFSQNTEEVYNICGHDMEDLELARGWYRSTGAVPNTWKMHPAYVYGNNRVSCRYCILGDRNDLETAKREDKDGLLDEMISMEKESGCTIKNKFSLTQLK